MKLVNVGSGGHQLQFKLLEQIKVEVEGCTLCSPSVTPAITLQHITYPQDATRGSHSRKRTVVGGVESVL